MDTSYSMAPVLCLFEIHLENMKLVHDFVSAV